MQRTVTHSELETEHIGRDLAQALSADPALPRYIALFGDLGAGKTAFTRGFVSALIPGARVKSPTFSIVKEYRGESVRVFHFDMYRIESEDDLYGIGYEDYLRREGFIVVEWPEKIPYAIPPSCIRVRIERSGGSPDERILSIEYPGNEVSS